MLQARKVHPLDKSIIIDIIHIDGYLYKEPYLLQLIEVFKYVYLFSNKLIIIRLLLQQFHHDDLPQDSVLQYIYR